MLSNTGLILCFMVAIGPHLRVLLPGQEFAVSAVFGVKSAWILSLGTFLVLFRLISGLRGRPLDVRTGLEKPLVAVILTSFLALSLTPYPTPLLFTFMSLVAHIAIFYVLVDFWRRSGSRRSVSDSPLLYAYLSGVLVSVHVLLQLYGIDKTQWAGGVEDWRGKLTAFMGGPSFIGGYLALVLPYGIWWTVSRRSVPFVVRLISIVPVVAALTATFSMGAWSGLLGGFVLCLFFRGFRRNLLSGRSLAVVGVFVFVLGFFFSDNPWNGLGRSILSEAEASNRWRTGHGARRFIWTATAPMIKDHPFFGVGFGNYNRVYHTYEGRYREKRGTAYERRVSPDVPQVHNEYYQQLVETGLVGFFAMVWLLASGARRLKRIAGNLSEEEFGPWLASLCGFTVAAVESLQNYPLRIPPNTLLVVIHASYVFAPHLVGRSDAIPKTGLPSGWRPGYKTVVGGAILFLLAAYTGTAPVLSDKILCKALYNPSGPDTGGIDLAVKIYPWSPHGWTWKSKYLAFGRMKESIEAARRAVSLHEAVPYRQRLRDLYRGGFQAPPSGSFEDATAVLAEGRKTLALNPTYAPLCVEQAILEMEAGDDQASSKLAQRAGVFLRELKEREDKTVFEAQMKEIMPYRKTHPKVMELTAKSIDAKE